MKKDVVKSLQSDIPDPTELPNTPALDQRIERLRDLRAERSLEFQILSTREQWFWIPWTTCLAGALYALSTSDPAIRIGVPVVTLFIALLFVRKRKPGLESSYRILTERHKAVIEITRGQPELKNLGFDPRLTEIKVGEKEPEIYDDAHECGFRYPLDIMSLTIPIWVLLIGLGIVLKVLPCIGK